MIVISYDISNDKLRTKFAKYLCKYGHRLQYSVFEIDNNERVLNNIEADIKNLFEKKFTQTDSIIIFRISKNCKITRYGYAKNDNSDMIIVT
ncbi:MAG TPA: CRISPR-associated endonuclease Cas2 [Candidatus Dorea intestinavium]|nr:CRISPR-associated endonuclease Cas2 [Candidatus Dorea intestinavium]